MSKEIKIYPEIGKNYKHYKGGKYNVLTMATHSESENVKIIFDKLNSVKLSSEAKKLINELKSSFEDNLVIYKSLHFGSVHARPLGMWFEKIGEDRVMNPAPIRFVEIGEPLKQSQNGSLL